VVESLRISEIMYHPAFPDAEFLELVNIGKQTLYLDLVQLTAGIHWTGGSVELKAGQAGVLVYDPAAFAGVYGTKPRILGQYQGRLSNGGERLRLEDAAGTAILDFRYSDRWHAQTDGEGYSLVLGDLETAPDAYGEPEAWQVSAWQNGSPGVRH
jgi:hypothetical protein